MLTPLAIGCATARTLRVQTRSGRVSVGSDQLALLAAGGQALTLLVGEGLVEPIILVSGYDGYIALGSTCTHLGCRVRPGRGAIICPCHGSTYNLQGAVTRGPAQRALTRYPVSIDSHGGISVVLSPEAAEGSE
ncbi:MAG: Rieske (2Fe-2S) protein [Candidatus Latescibacterota bacterium]|nr:Rieske (2Fe-2S) protein [Candidatus Latescibacterota bacterium]